MLKHIFSKHIIPQRVVVLGSSGFIGMKLIEFLKLNNVSCLGLSTKDVNLSNENGGQLLAKHLLPNDVVVVLSVQKPNRNMDPSSLIVNLQIANNICQAIHDVVPAHVIYFSSDAVYSFKNELINENTPPQPPNLYGIMHLAREMIFQDAAHKDKIPLVIVRSTQVYGPTANHNAYGPGQFCSSAKRESNIMLFGKGEERRDFIAVEDIAKLTYLLMLHKSEGCINLATGSSISFAELAKIVSEQSGKQVTITCQERKQEITHRIFDISLLKQAFPDFVFTNLKNNIKAFF